MVNASRKVRATTHNMVSHATCTKGDNFSATYTENHTVDYNFMYLELKEKRGT